MAEPGDLDALTREHDALRDRMPRTWNAFFARFAGLRPVQLAAMYQLLDGNPILITAPTAGGKMEAALAPLCERLLGNAWPGLSVLLITPTRSLVNDLYHRLKRPCEMLALRL